MVGASAATTATTATTAAMTSGTMDLAATKSSRDDNSNTREHSSQSNITVPTQTAQPTTTMSTTKTTATITTATTTMTTSTTTTTTEFHPEICLFCTRKLGSLAKNRSHMRLQHGLDMPSEEHLLVDLEVLLRYMHSVIYEYNECLCCHTIRNSPHAIQQHMLSQGHCQVDFEAEDSEFHEFCDFDLSEEDDEVEDEEAEAEAEADSGDDLDGQEEDEPVVELPGEALASLTLDVGAEDTLRLPSGKVLENRKSVGRKVARRRKLPTTISPDRHGNDDGAITRREEDEPQLTSNSDSQRITTDTYSSTSIALTNKQEKRTRDFQVQLSSMRKTDQRALAHLPLPEQRARLAIAQKQEAKANDDQKRFRAKMDVIGNVSSKERFVNDVPGGKSHRNRFFAT